MQAVLEFVRPTVRTYLQAIRRFAACGASRFALRLADSAAQGLLAEVAAAIAAVPGIRFTIAATCADREPGPPPLRRAAIPAGLSDGADQGPHSALVHVLFATSPAALASQLEAFVDRFEPLIAPKLGDHDDALTVVTIPKSGTHLLLELLAEMGYAPAGTLSPDSRREYQVLDGTLHYPFDRLHLLMAERPDGGYAHPLFTRPVLFGYRHPLDILLSESDWYGKPGTTYLNHYFGSLTREARLRDLLRGTGVLEAIQERLLSYQGWIGLPNVLPVSFEELVGARGGGSEELQSRAIWALQLRLRVAGQPDNFGRLIGRRGSRTFNQGRAGRFREILTETHYRWVTRWLKVALRAFGYSARPATETELVSRHVEAWRRRPLQLVRDEPAPRANAPTPIPATEPEPDTACYRYLGYVIQRLPALWVAAPPESGRIEDPRRRGTPGVLVDLELDSLRTQIERLPRGMDPWRVQPSPPLRDQWHAEPRILGNLLEHNLIEFRGEFIGVPQALGEVDFFDPEDLDDERLCRASSLAELEATVTARYVSLAGAERGEVTASRACPSLAITSAFVVSPLMSVTSLHDPLACLHCASACDMTLPIT